MNGTPVDPLKIKSPPVEPIKPENMETFRNVVAEFTVQLDSAASGGNIHYAVQ